MTKEHFWNLLQAQFPEQMADFCAWIDEFKRRVEWEKIFGGTRYTVEGNVYHTPVIYSPKFHDLPPAMQIGIFIQYTVETGGSPFPVPVDLSFEAWIGAIPRWFEMEHELSQKPAE